MHYQQWPSQKQWNSSTMYLSECCDVYVNFLSFFFPSVDGLMFLCSLKFYTILWLWLPSLLIWGCFILIDLTSLGVSWECWATSFKMVFDFLKADSRQHSVVPLWRVHKHSSSWLLFWWPKHLFIWSMPFQVSAYEDHVLFILFG